MEREPEVSGAASIRDLGGQVGVLAEQRLSGAFLRAGAVDRGLADRGESVVVAVVVFTGFGEAPRAQQEPTNALGDHFIEPRDVVVARRRRVVKHRDAVVGDRVDAIEHEHVEMWIELQGRIESLHETDRARLACGDSMALGVARHPREHSAQEDPAHAREQLRLVGKCETDVVRKRQDPLAHGDLRDHGVDEMRRRLGHAPAGTGRTETPSFA